jgi:hypothetical protein
MRGDRYTEWFAGFEPEPPQGNEPKKPKFPLISVLNSDVYEGYRETISDGNRFQRSEDLVWPLAKYETSRGSVHVELRPDTDQPLLPEEQDQIAEEMFERAKKFSDIEADVCDILTHNWLKDAKDVNHRALIQTDDLCRMRGLKPHLGGNGRRGGYGREQRLTHLRAAASIFESWIIAREAPVYGKKNRPVGRRVLESRPFVVTDRVGDHRFSWHDAACYDRCIDVLAFKYVVGEVFGSYLFANREVALLSERALNYSAKKFWEKRLTRYYSYLWRCRASYGDFLKPLTIGRFLMRACAYQSNPEGSAKRRSILRDHILLSNEMA